MGKHDQAAQSPTTHPAPQGPVPGAAEVRALFEAQAQLLAHQLPQMDGITARLARAALAAFQPFRDSGVKS